MTAHPARLREARESSYSSRARVVAYLNEQSLNVAQAPHPNHRKVWLTQQSGPLPEGEGEGRARRRGLRRLPQSSRNLKREDSPVPGNYPVTRSHSPLVRSRRASAQTTSN